MDYNLKEEIEGGNEHQKIFWHEKFDFTLGRHNYEMI